VLVGLLMAGILYFARSVSSKLAIYRKDRAMKRAKHKVADLEQRVYDLEAEKAQRKTSTPSPAEHPHHMPQNRAGLGADPSFPKSHGPVNIKP